MSGYHVNVSAVVIADSGDFCGLTREASHVHRARLVATVTALIEQAMAIHDFKGWSEDSTVAVTIAAEKAADVADDPPAS